MGARAPLGPPGQLELNEVRMSLNFLLHNRTGQPKGLEEQRQLADLTS